MSIRLSTIFFILAAALGIVVLNMACESARMRPEDVSDFRLVSLGVLTGGLLGLGFKFRNDND